MEPEIASLKPQPVSPTTVVITGVSGLIGQRLLPSVEAVVGIEHIVGLDTREPQRRVKALEVHLVDLVTADIAALLKGADVVVHLGGIVGPASDAELARRVNIDGTRALLTAMNEAGVHKIVRPSSAAVYGAWLNNALPLTEDAQIRPNGGYQPALLDAECERCIADWAASDSANIATILRLAPVVGSGARSVFARAAVGRPPAVVRGSKIPTQVVHVDDVASAITYAIEHDLRGVYNVAADGWLDHDDAAAVAPHRLPPAVPQDVAHTALNAMWSSGIGDAPPEVMPYLMHAWVISNEKLKAAGWAPKHTNEEAILLAGDPDARRRPLPWIAAVGAVLGGAGGATWWLTRRRQR